MPGQAPSVSLPPFEIDITRAAIPASTTDVTTVDSWISSITVQLPASAGASVLLTVEDKQASPVALLDGVSIDPGQIMNLQFDPPARMPGGITWEGDATGLIGTIRGWRVSGWAVEPGTGFVYDTV